MIGVDLRLQNVGVLCVLFFGKDGVVELFLCNGPVPVGIQAMEECMYLVVREVHIQTHQALSKLLKRDGTVLINVEFIEKHDDVVLNALVLLCSLGNLNQSVINIDRVGVVELVGLLELFYLCESSVKFLKSDLTISIIV